MANPYRDPYAVVALLGPDGSGKSTLQQDVARVDGRATTRPVQVNGRAAAVMEIPTPTRMLQLVNFADFETQSALLGASPFSGAVLVVSAADSLMPAHQKSLEHVRQLRIPLLAVALTKGDIVPDEELLDLVEMEIRELVNKHGFQGDAMPIVRIRAQSTRPHEGREPERGRPTGPGTLVAIIAR